MVSGVNVLVFGDNRMVISESARGITGFYTSRNTDNGIFVIRAEPSHKNICLTRNLPAGFCMEITPLTSLQHSYDVSRHFVIESSLQPVTVM